MTRRIQLVIVPLPYHNKNSDRAESSKAHERKHGPDNTISDRPQQRTSLNQEELDRLLDAKCPWYKDANHMAHECRALSNSVALEDPKRPRLDDCDRPGRSRSSYGRGHRNR